MDKKHENMDKKTMHQVLLPAAGAAAVVLFLGVLIATGNNPQATPTTGENSAGAPFPVDAPEWQPVDAQKYPNLKFWDVKEGTGKVCPSGARVELHYTGWLTNGTKFDSSKDRGEPITFSLTGLIPGWQYGVPGMKEGGVRRLMIPAELGYGSSGSGTIPPGATLLFEIELLGIKS